MASFSDISWRRLTTCHEDLIVLMDRVIEVFDFTIIFGYRGQEEQEEAYRRGHSTKQWPHSLHNRSPAMAVDIAPWYKSPPRVRWNDTERFYYLAGMIMHEGYELRQEGVISHRVRWGGDWDQDTEVRDQTFFDLGHYELVT